LAAAQRLADAERQSDVPALQELLAPDYAGYDPAGRPQDRSSVVRAYADGSVRLKILEQSDLRARVMGEVGLVAGVSKLQGSQGAEFFDFRLRFLEVYAWRDGRWQLVASLDTYLSRRGGKPAADAQVVKPHAGRHGRLQLGLGQGAKRPGGSSAARLEYQAAIGFSSHTEPTSHGAGIGGSRRIDSICIFREY